MSRKLLPLAVAVALAEAAGAALIVTTSNHEPHKVATTALALTAGLTFVASGLVAMQRRPENRTGLYLAAVGYLWFLGALGDANNHIVWTAGVFVYNLAFIPFAALVLAFPTGQLAPRPDRLLVRATAGFVLIGPPLLLLFDKRSPSCGKNCGESAIVVYHSPTIERIVDVAETAYVIVLIVIVVTVLVRRWRRASTALRRLLLPVYVAGSATLLVLLTSNLLSTFSTTASDALGHTFLVFFAAVPMAFLLGILRSRLARGSAADLVVAIGHGTPMRDAIAEALGDPSLEVGYCVDDGRRLVDRDGRRFDLPAEGSGRAVTTVEHDGRRVGALVHDASLSEERELVESVAATVALALDNERLEADLRAQYDFLTTIVDTAPSLLLTLDPEGRIRNLNPATVVAAGYDNEEEVRGRYFWDVFIDDSEREAMVARFHAAAPQHPPAEYENVFTNARRERRVIAWRSAPVLDDTGSVLRIIGGGLDITQRKRDEEELRASRTRIVAAEDEARRRLERNLHDGAQQRLVALSVAIFQYGWGSSLLNFRSNGGIASWLPIFMFVILFGLSMDYHVFILSRVREAFDRGMKTEDAVAHGIKTTAGTVSSAALVMVGVFSIFATLPILDMKELGIGLAAAVLIDATIVRAVLLPATMKLLGDWNWYLPNWLGWLPKIEQHGEPSVATV